MKFKRGEIAVFSLTGEHVMILENIQKDDKSYQPGYWVRFPDHSAAKVADFELVKRDLNE